MNVKNLSKRLGVFVAICGLIAGCAGTATHKVVAVNKANDDALSCQQIDGELISVQLIVDDVNQDKADVSGADVMDGILWFPFNLIAKHSNYKDALAAADKRTARLNDLRK